MSRNDPTNDRQQDHDLGRGSDRGPAQDGRPENSFGDRHGVRGEVGTTYGGMRRADAPGPSERWAGSGGGASEGWRPGPQHEDARGHGVPDRWSGDRHGPDTWGGGGGLGYNGYGGPSRQGGRWEPARPSPGGWRAQDDPGHDRGHDPDHDLDPEYLQWRAEQMRALDSEYRTWRGERYKKFADEFGNWRRERERTASASNPSKPDDPETVEPR